MFKKFRQWREKRILSKSPFTHDDWHLIAKTLPVLSRLTQPQLEKLFKLATLFLHDKTFSGAQEFVVTDTVRQSVALQACLPILNLGLDWFKGWSSIIIYPAAFKRESSTVDAFGVTHTGDTHLSGEAWLRGPIVLAWTDTVDAGQLDGHNVVIHEFVHKLDMLNGRANGFPPMQQSMDQTQWAQLMSTAFADFQQHPKKGLDRYGATDPAEFFAVLSEVFFETPELLHNAYPEIYQLMTQFFIQTTLSTKA